MLCNKKNFGDLLLKEKFEKCTLSVFFNLINYNNEHKKKLSIIA